MTTVRQIITDAFREGGIIQIGTTPEAEQVDEALRKLQSIVTQLLGNEMGEPLQTVVYGRSATGNSFAQDQDKQDYIDSYFLPSNVQLIVDSNSAQTIFLDPNPRAGARFSVVDLNNSFASGNLTVKANGRKIEGSNQVVLNTDGTNSQWFYRDDLANWVKVTDLGLDEQSPYPSEFDELLILSLAFRLNPRYQQQTAPETIQAWRQAKSQFRSRYRQTEFVPSDVSRLYWNGFAFLNPTTAFNRGIVTD